MKKRILAILMCALMIVSTVLMLASCNNDNKGNNKGDGPDIKWLDKLGDHDLGGYTVKFAVSEAQEDEYGFNERSIVADENTGDKVDAAIFKRNEAIKERFNCDIQLKYLTNESLASTIGNTLMAGGSDYDVIAGRQYSDVALCVNGYLVNLAKNKEANEYLDWSREYWGGDYIKGFSYKDNVYWLTGDLNLRYTGGFYGVFVNAQIYNQSLRETYGDIHTIVKEGQWDIELMKKLSDTVSSELSTKPVAGDIPSDAIIGVAAPIHDNTNGWAVSCGVKFSTTSKSGNVSFKFTQSNKTLKEFYTGYMALINSNGCVDYSSTGYLYGGYKEAFEPFIANQALFVPGRINQAELYLRKMTDDYYIIPNPKLTETQEEYISSLHDAISIYGIAKGCENVKATAIVLEAMAAETYRTVRTEYYDKALKNKYTTDPNTAAMIDTITANTHSDFALCWAFTSYFDGLGGFLRAEMRAGTEDVTRSLVIKGTVWSKTGMEQVDEAFAKLAEIEKKA